jgi:hypothetical protein
MVEHEKWRGLSLMNNNKLDAYRNQQDNAWKDVLEAYFKDFMCYCLPDLYQLIDWKKPVTSLDKEFQTITKGAKAGKRLADKLFQVFLKDGSEQWILIHIEVQGSFEKPFPKRMFIYAYRIFDKYQRPLISCAILTDAKKNWRPNEYQVGFGRSYLYFRFITIKLLDYQAQKTELENSYNPFASVILVQLAAIEKIMEK